MSSATIPLEHDTYYHIYNRGINGCNLYRVKNDYKRFLRLYEKHIDPIADTFAWVLMPNHFHLLVRIKSEEEISKYYTKPDRLNNQDASKPVGSNRSNGLNNQDASKPVWLKEITKPDRLNNQDASKPVGSNRSNGLNNQDASKPVWLKEITKPDRLNNQDASKPVGLNNQDANKPVGSNVGLKPPHQHFSNLCNAYSKYINIKYKRTGSLFERPFKRKRVEDETYLRTLVLYIDNNPIHHGFTDVAVNYPWSSYRTCLSVKPTKLKRKDVIEWFDDKANFRFVHQQQIDFMTMDEWLKI